MAKHYECTVSSRGDIPAHSDAMGIALSSMCAVPMLRWGEKALADCRAHKVTDELTEVILGIIVSTGLVSNFVQVDYTTGLAHAVYNGFTVLKSTEENHHLHGEVVSYGILVLLTVDKQYKEREKYSISTAPWVCRQSSATFTQLPTMSEPLPRKRSRASMFANIPMK